MARLSTRNRLASSSNEEEPHGQCRFVGGCCVVSRSLPGHFPGDLYVKAVSCQEGSLSGRCREDVRCVGEILLAADDALDLPLCEGGRFLIRGRTDIGDIPTKTENALGAVRDVHPFFAARGFLLAGCGKSSSVVLASLRGLGENPSWHRTLPAHHLAGAHRRGAPYSSRRAPRWPQQAWMSALRNQKDGSVKGAVSTPYS